jgi:hypothetical protein
LGTTAPPNVAPLVEREHWLRAEVSPTFVPYSGRDVGRAGAKAWQRIAGFIWLRSQRALNGTIGAMSGARDHEVHVSGARDTLRGAVTKLAWVHISDWHQRGAEFERSKVREALLADLGERASLDPDLAEVGFLVFSGDIAFSGQPIEYEVAHQELIVPALEVLGLAPDRLVVVPGNHDVDRASLEWQRPDLIKELATKEAVAAAQSDPQALGYFAAPFAAYSKFVRAAIPMAPDEPALGYRRLLQCGDVDVLVLAVNTALVSGRAKDADGEVSDQGALFIGEPELHRLISDSPAASLRVVVMHHPFSWLAEFERYHLRRKIVQFADFVLHGHEHTPAVEVLSTVQVETVSLSQPVEAITQIRRTRSHTTWWLSIQMTTRPPSISDAGAKCRMPGYLTPNSTRAAAFTSHCPAASLPPMGALADNRTRRARRKRVKPRFVNTGDASRPSMGLPIIAASPASREPRSPRRSLPTICTLPLA